MSGWGAGDVADPVLTTGEASKLCAVDARTIARWADAGLLPSHRTVGGRRRILRSDLEGFLRQHGMPMLPQRQQHLRRIAVVDDDPRVVRALERMVLRIIPDADCRSAHDGFSAGALLTTFRPDLVFLDVIMPGLSGLEVCEYIRATPSLAKTMVVAVSGHFSKDVRARLAAVGVERCISKPFSRSELESVVAEWVKASSAPNAAVGAGRGP